jgi:hypothetical protein
VLGDAAHADLGVLGVDPAEHDQRFGVIVDGRPPVLMLVEHGQEIDPEHVGHDGLRASRGIAAERGDIAADAVEEPVCLALGMVEAPRRGPAVGAAEDRLVAVFAANAVDLMRRDVECLVPGKLDKVVAAAPAALGLVQPTSADRGTQDAGLVMDGGGEDVGDTRGIGIPGERARDNHAAIGDIHLEGAPMAGSDFGGCRRIAGHACCPPVAVRFGVLMPRRPRPCGTIPASTDPVASAFETGSRDGTPPGAAFPNDREHSSKNRRIHPPNGNDQARTRTSRAVPPLIG